MKKVNYGIIGFGNSGQVHCKVLNRLNSADLVAVCDSDYSKLRLAEELYGVKTFSKSEEMIDSGGVEAVSVCTPHFSHSQIATYALSRGVNVLCEKPMATNLADAEKMIEAVKQNGAYLGIISQHRFEPINKILKREINKGNLGKIISTSISVKWKKTADYYRNSWQGKKSEAGGGVLINQAIHYIDLASWLNQGVHSVYALSKTSRDYVDIEDNAIAIIEYKNGAFGVFDCSTSTNPFLGSEIEVIGTKNSVKTFDGKIIEWGGKTREEIQKLNLRISRLDSETWGKKYFGYGHIFQIRDFLRSISSKREPAINGPEGKKTLEIILSLMSSAELNKKIVLT